jgi:endoglycosylceramidase
MIVSPKSFRGMFVLSLLFVLLGTCLGTVEAQANPQRRATATTYTGFLHVQGRWFVDEAGNYVILRGANFFKYEFGWLNTHTEADYQKMASWGFNVVRLPIAWNLIEPTPNQYDDTYLQRTVDQDLVWAQKYFIHIVIDMHQTCWSPRFTYCDAWTRAGVPLWATTSYNDTELGQAQARGDFWKGLGPNGTPVTASNPSMQDRFSAMWQHVARRYSSSTVVAGYDLFNEPYSWQIEYKYGPYDLGTFSHTILPAFYTRLIDSIRPIDSNHIFFWEEPSSIALSRPNTAYSPHYPGYSDFSGYDASSVRSAMESLAATSQQWNVPIFVGEWGMYASGNNVTGYIRDFSDLLDKYAMSSTWWSYGKSSFEMTLQDESGNDRVILTKNLIRPYVGISSAIPSYSSFGVDTKELRVSVNGPSQVGIYTAGYALSQVSADGGAAPTFQISTNKVVDVQVSSSASQLAILFS